MTRSSGDKVYGQTYLKGHRTDLFEKAQSMKQFMSPVNVYQRGNYREGA